MRKFPLFGKASSEASKEARFRNRGVGLTVGIAALIGSFITINESDTEARECHPVPHAVEVGIKEAFTDAGTPLYEDWNDQLFTNQSAEFRTLIEPKVVELAAQRDFTVFAPSVYTGRLHEAETNEEVIDILASFLSNYGISVEAEEDIDTFDNQDLRILTAEYIRAYQLIPVELVYALPKRPEMLSFESDLSSKEGLPAEALAVVGEGIIKVDPAKARIEAITHELGHFIGASCDREDPELALLNASSFEYDQNNPDPAQNVFQTENANKNVRETAAEYYSQIFRGNAPVSTGANIDSFTIDKFLLLQGRLEHILPGITGFYSAVRDEVISVSK